MMRTCVLGSGSRGNAVYVATARTRVLIDCGFNFKETKSRLAAAGLAPEGVDAILLTHEHHDHVQGASVCSNGFGAPLYATAATRAAAAKALVRETRPETLDAARPLVLGDLEIEPIRKIHDAAEPLGFLLHAGGATLGVFTDLGRVDDVVGAAVARCDTLLLEANHDPELLRRGPYPPSLKARIGGGEGHLSNAAAAEALRRYAGPRLKRVVVCHLSETNNHPDEVRGAFVRILGPPAAYERRWSFQDRPTPVYDVPGG
jgi:phosphoribosyl 1,2-cyclic phosphodiesterase